MSKNYDQETLDRLSDWRVAVYIEFKSGYKDIGYIIKVEKGYELLPLNVENGRMFFKRTAVKKLINSYNGFVYQKTWQVTSKRQASQYKILNLIELSDLINQAGYEFL